MNDLVDFYPKGSTLNLYWQLILISQFKMNENWNSDLEDTVYIERTSALVFLSTNQEPANTCTDKMSRIMKKLAFCL